jgi:hypothetical protein
VDCPVSVHYGRRCILDIPEERAQAPLEIRVPDQLRERVEPPLF